MLHRTRRRDLIGLVAGAAVARPFATLAQQAPLPIVGILGAATGEAWSVNTAALRRGLSQAGYEEGRNVAFEYRWAEGRYDRLPALAAELLDRDVQVIVALTTPAALAAKAATKSVPIVFVMIGDPVRLGVVGSLSRPGGNVTGVAQLNLEMGPKLLEAIHDAVPQAGAIALLVNPAGPNASTLTQELQSAAGVLGVQLHVLTAGSTAEIEAAFARLRPLGAGALVIGGDPFFHSLFDQLVALALRYRVPSIYQTRQYPEAGGLMSYGSVSLSVYRAAGVYAGRILKGENPADLPVQQAAKFELVINLKTARALGLTMPQSLLARADEVIE